MEAAVSQVWQRNKGNTRVEVKDRMFHLGQWWVLVVITDMHTRKCSWWVRESSFVDRYTLLDNADVSSRN